MTTKSNHSDEQAFTIIEILVVVVIIGILASIVVISFNSTLTKSRISKAKADIENIDKAMNAYKIDVGELPPRGDCCSVCACGTWAAWGQTQWDRAIEALRSNDGANWSGPYLKSAIPQDPWGHFYCYDDNDVNSNCGDSYLISAGPNGVWEGGGGDDIRLTVTYRPESGCY